MKTYVVGTLRSASVEYPQHIFSGENFHLDNPLTFVCGLTLKMPRKPASENVICLCRLLHLLANFSNILFAFRQTVWTQIRLLQEEQSDLGPLCLQQ